MTRRRTPRRPVYALESGPAAGVVASLALAPRARTRERDHLRHGRDDREGLADRGREGRRAATSTRSAPRSRRGSRLLRGSGELIRIPTIDIAEVGAGGGSIAWVDAAGGLHVGPRSAGAMPGPACYGRGGERADRDRRERRARLHPDRAARLGRPDRLRAARRRGASTRLGAPARACRLETARGIHELANAAMMRALRAVSTEKGRDPRRLRPPRLRRLGPGARRRARRGARRPHGDRPAARRALLGRRTALRAGRVPRRPLLPLDARDGDLAAAARARRTRCASRSQAAIGQRRANRVAAPRRRPLPRPELEPHGRVPRAIDAAALAALVERFEAEHERLYGTRLDPGSPVDIRALRLIALGPDAPPFALRRRSGGDAAPDGDRGCADFGDGTAPSRRRCAAAPRSAPSPVAGPLLLDEYDTTVVVPPAGRSALDADRRPRARPRRGRPARPASGARGRHRPRARRQRARDRPPTRWRRRSSAPPTRRSSATRWTSRPRSAAPPARRSPRR